MFFVTWLLSRGYEVTNAEKAFVVSASIAMGAASYYLVEQPLQRRRDIWPASRLVLSATFVFLSLLSFTGIAFYHHGFPKRLPEYLLAAEEARKTGTPRDECFRNSNSLMRANVDHCVFGVREAAGGPSAILWGDSFANQYLNPISFAAVNNGIHGLIATQSACRPFLDDDQTATESQSCRDFNRRTLDFLLQDAGPNIAILGGNWGKAQEIIALADRLLISGKTVILIMPTLNIGFDLPQQWINNQLRAGKAILEWRVEADPVLTRQRLREDIVAGVDRLKNRRRLITLDPQTVVCDSSHCYLVRHGSANFRDSVHISNVNASQYENLVDAAFKSALQAQGETAAN